MIWEGDRAQRALRRTRDRPELPLTPFDPTEVLEQMRVERVPEVTRPVPCFIGDISPLACMIPDGEGSGTVLIHSILNNPHTPLMVMKLIATHELLHLVVPHEEIEGKWVSHPPAFWTLENERCPEKKEAWRWIYTRFRFELTVDKEQEAIFVRRNWRRNMDFLSPDFVTEDVNIALTDTGWEYR